MATKPKKAAGKAAPRKRKKGTETKEAPDPLRLAIPQFHGRLDGLRKLQEIISPHVAALDISEDGGVRRLIDKGGFSEAGIGVMREIFESGGNSGDEDVSGGDVVVGAGGGDAEADPTQSEKRSLQFADVVLNEREAFQGFLRKLLRGAMAPREDLLNSSLLTLAVAAFENLLAMLVAEHLRRFPGMLEAEEKAFSLADLQGVGSIDDARTVLIEKRVDSFMRKGFDDWSKWAERTLGAGFAELCIDEDSVQEIFQRRHLVVHAGGIVNRMYLERAPIPNSSAPKLGAPLPTTGDYVINALDEFEVLGDLLLFSAWSKWTEGEDRASAKSEFESRILELMAARRWQVVQRLCEKAAEMDFSASSRLVFKVNRWIAMRHLEEFDDECREDVRNWDTSALAVTFVMARAVLLDEEKNALEFLEAALAAGEMSKRDAETWPLLSGLCESPKFGKAVTRGVAQAKAAGEAGKSEPANAGPKRRPKRPRAKGGASRKAAGKAATKEASKTSPRRSSRRMSSGAKAKSTKKSSKR